MPNVDAALAPPLIPAVAYDDAAAAIRWVTDMLGLRMVRTFEMPDGTIAHAELAWRQSMVFVTPDHRRRTRGPSSARHRSRARVVRRVEAAAGASRAPPAPDTATRPR